MLIRKVWEGYMISPGKGKRIVVTDLTKEHPNKTLWRFLLPMMLSVMFQQIYNIADSMIAGKFAGEDALAAVGASYPITVIFMAFAVGMNLGTSVIVSRLFGAGDRKGVKRAVTTAFVASGVLGIALTVFGCVACRSMMVWIRTPENILADGELYLKIYVFGLLFLMLYNVCTGVCTALGDSKTPLYFLLGSSAGNILLDFLFVAKFRWGVSGVAWATFIAQGISAILVLITVLHRLSAMTADKQPLFDVKLCKQILAIAVPSILQQSVLSVGNLVVQAIINQYGSAVVAFLHIVSPWYLMIVVKLMTDGIIRGYGAMLYFVLATIPDLILRIIFALIFSQKFASTGIWMAWPFGWLAATGLTIFFYRKVLKKMGVLEGK